MVGLGKGKLWTTSVVAVLSVALVIGAILPSMVTAQVDEQKETADRVTKYEQHREELRITFEKIVEEHEKISDLEKQKADAFDEEEKQDLNERIRASLQEIDRLESQMKEVEQLIVPLFKVDPELKERLEAVETELFNKYMSDSPSDVENNPVEVIFTDLLRRQVAIIVDPEKVADDGSNLPTERIVDGIPVHIEYSKVKETSCSSVTSECRPLIGGISVAEKNTLSLNSLGYKAFRNGQEGFVMAGHSAVGVLKDIVQPHNDPSKRVGLVVAHCYQPHLTLPDPCDYAFVRKNPGIDIDNKIFLSSTATFSIIDKTAKSQQTVGTQVVKSGAATGLTNGIVWQNNPGQGHVHAELLTQNGDSGGPVFYYIGGSGNSVSLYGMIFKNYQYQGMDMTMYYPWDTISNKIGASPP